ncbi:TspO/MBR family protein [Microbacterium sp. G2-8]|uniref:TspO/MBR family protein n=1 Tax=Microbacterium sp. G2-8 TaxID=2842454 RepID=UPI001C89512B|nr:TspO/MBR family protein [Microbacterium sp. G2-8]
MKRSNSPAVQILVAVVLLLAVAGIAAGGSLATAPNVDGWYADAEKVPWNPPGGVFGPAWTVLYLLIAAAGFLLWRAIVVREKRSWDGVLTVYIVQLALNAAWTPIFFAGYPLIGETAWWLALAVMVALIVAVIWLMALATRRSKIATLLLAPYLVWILFASTLNMGIIALN